MVDTFQALGVFLLALLPGALYVWAFEREAGGWGLGLTDRLLRFVGVSAVFHALAAPITYLAYKDLVVSGRLAHASNVPWWLWPVALGYVAVPAAAGTAVGNGVAAGKTWTRYVAGRAPAPRAWDHLFAREGLSGWVRLKLKSGDWIVGAYGRSGARDRSYAAGYPETQDLYLVDTAECDPSSGKFVLNQGGGPLLRGVSVLIRWDEVMYLEFITVQNQQ